MHATVIMYKALYWSWWMPLAGGGPLWYENLSGVVSCPENSNINADGLDSGVIGSRDQ